MTTLASLAWAADKPLALAPDAPERYVVTQGDTLWDIARRFLQSPWRWPELWRLNREQLANPHLIYPGDILYLDESQATPRLRRAQPIGETAASPPERREVLTPQIRAEPAPRTAVPTVSASAIAPFINRPLVVNEQGLREHPRIVATQEDRVYLGRGDLAYARGFSPQPGSLWHLYRAAQPLLDPDTRKPIGWEAMYVGSARVERSGDPVTLRIVEATEEVGVGDRLMPAEAAASLNFAPHAPTAPVAGRVVSIHRGVAMAGRNGVVAINVGSRAGLEVGHVLAIRQHGNLAPDREAGGRKPEMVKLPDESVGHLLVFRVFENIAYGLIMDVSRSVAVGDVVTTP